jgi:hypothetical protein
MPFLIPFIIGASGTGYLWYDSTKEEDKEPTFNDELLKVAVPVLSIIAILLFFRWLYLKGSNLNTKTT